MTFTHMGKPVAPAVVRRQYRVILDKIQRGELNVRLRSILSTIMKTRHVFRGGTSIDNDDKERRQYYTDLIAECKDEMSQTATTRTHQTSAVRTRKRVINLLGRRVVMSADVFGGREDECYNGVVVRKTKYTQDGKTKNGYAVKWHDGDVDVW